MPVGVVNWTDIRMGLLVLSFVLSSLDLSSAEEGLSAQANLRSPKAGKLELGTSSRVWGGQQLGQLLACC